jgi:hypothetical protein
MTIIEELLEMVTSIQFGPELKREERVIDS